MKALKAAGRPFAAASAPSSRLFTAAASFLVVFCVSYASILLTRGDQALAPVWPANAIVLVILLRAPLVKKAREDIIVSAVAGSVLANWFGGHSLPLALWFTAANAIEISIALVLIRRDWGQVTARKGSLVLAQFTALLRAAFIAPAIAATIAACGLTVLAGVPYRDAWLDWFFTATLGFLLVAPIGMRIHSDDLRLLKSKASLQSAALCIALIVAMALFVFAQKRVPLLFLIAPVVLFAAYRHRTLGAAIAIALIAAVAVPLTANGYGPFVIFKFVSPKAQQFGLQFFLLTQTLIALWLAALLDDRDSLRRALEFKEKTSREKAAAQAQLMTNVAHELRTPLNAIQGLGEILQTQEALSDQGQTLLETIVSASVELQTLANDLLDRSRIERGALRIQQQIVPLRPLFAEIENELHAFENLPRADVDIQVVGNLTIWADPLRTKQIIRNLVVNAIKYAGSYGPIALRATAHGDVIRIEVKDRGPGIPLIRQHEVFEPFGRLGPESASNVSAGIGLSMVKLLAEAQNGVAGFSSAPHIETRFWVDLPANAPRGASLLQDPTDSDVDAIFRR